MIETLNDIVNDYIHEYRAIAKAEVRSFAREPTLSAAVSRAAKCQLPDGKRHPHQYRIPAASLQEAERRLLSALRSIEQAKSFDELHKIVKEHINDIWMIDELTVYDTAHRIGGFRRLMPELVYLHRGTRDGARMLGFSGSRTTLSRSALPPEFVELEAYEIEDCLCIYKDKLRGAAKPNKTSCRRTAINFRKRKKTGRCGLHSKRQVSS